MSSNPTVRKRLIAALAAVLCLAAGTFIGDRFLPFRGSGASYEEVCDATLSTVDMGFIPQTDLTGRRITTAAFEESGRGDAYRFDCTVYGDGEQQLQARVGITGADEEAWREDLKDRGRLPGRTKPLDITAPGALGNVEGRDFAALSADSSAALYLPCELPGGKTAHLNVSVTAPGASDGDADGQRLTIAAIASHIAHHSVLKAGCLRPLAVPHKSPTFAS